MNATIAIARQHAIDPVELLRRVLVVTCALALICAGQALPL